MALRGMRVNGAVTWLHHMVLHTRPHVFASVLTISKGWSWYRERHRAPRMAVHVLLLVRGPGGGRARLLHVASNRAAWRRVTWAQWRCDCEMEPSCASTYIAVLVEAFVEMVVDEHISRFLSTRISRCVRRRIRRSVRRSSTCACRPGHRLNCLQAARGHICSAQQQCTSNHALAA